MSGRKYLKTAPPADFNKRGLGFEMKRKRKRATVNVGRDTDLDKSFSKGLTVGRVALTQ